jgi:hypothetical protein
MTKKRYRYCHCLRLKEWKYLVLRVKVARETEYRDFLLRRAYPLDKVRIGLGAGARPEVRYPCPREMAYLGVAVVHPEAEPIRARRIKATQVLDPFIARSALPMLPTAQRGAAPDRQARRLP